MGQALRAVLVIALLGVVFVWSALRQERVEREALAASLERAVASGVLAASPAASAGPNLKVDAIFAGLAVPLGRLPWGAFRQWASPVGGLPNILNSLALPMASAHKPADDSKLLDEVRGLMAGAPAGPWPSPLPGQKSVWTDADTVLRQLPALAVVACREAERLASQGQGRAAIDLLSESLQLFGRLQVFRERELVQVTFAQELLLRGFVQLLAMPGDKPGFQPLDVAYVRSVLGPELVAGASRARARVGLGAVFDSLLSTDRMGLFEDERNLDGIAESLEWLERWAIGDDPSGRRGFSIGRIMGKPRVLQCLLSANSCWLGSQRQHAHALALLVLLEQAESTGDWPLLLPGDAPEDPVTGAAFRYMLAPDRVELEALPVSPRDYYLSLPEPPAWSRRR